jgi:hypothetical protein
MPTISMFYGIIIRMYYAPAEHNPPHFHVYYQDYRAIIDINTCELIGGQLPKRQLKLTLAWAEIHKDDLLANWSLCQNGETPFAIEALK